jgi:3-phosphoshikimate 1-carboxyvinyltransferase
MEPDWSSAANFAVAGALTGGITLKGMPLGTEQADEYILEMLELFGHTVSKVSDGEMHDITIMPGKTSCADTCREISLHHCPDLFPIASLLACMSSGTTIFDGVGRLAQKESNRAESIYWEFTKLGFDIRIDGDKMYICGSGGLRQDGSTKQFLCSSHNDHRIAMALHIAALAGNMDIRLNNIECIDKSFPSFLGRLKK